MNPCLRESGGAVLLSLKVVPRASRDGFAGMAGGELRLRVTAPPVDSAANEAVVEFLADCLGIPRRNVVLLRGAASPHKTVSITGIPAGEVARRLGIPA